MREISSCVLCFRGRNNLSIISLLDTDHKLAFEMFIRAVHVLILSHLLKVNGRKSLVTVCITFQINNTVPFLKGFRFCSSDFNQC